MRIGFDASPLHKRRSGVGHYAASLLEGLCRQFPQERFLFLSHQPSTRPDFPNLIRTQEQGFPVKEIWMQLWLPRVLRLLSPDLCHFTNSVAPLRLSSPYALTVHDLSLVRNPEWHPLSRRIWMRRLLRPSILGARIVICDSEATRRDLLSWLSLDPARTRVVPLGFRSIFDTVCTELVKDRVLKKYRLPRKFFLHVGNLEPRKNLPLLVEAFARARLGDTHLVLAGGRAWLWKNIAREIRRQGIADRVHLPGYVAEEDLPALYQSALALVYPSMMEGFGLPVLEAMACATPVIVSRIEPLASLAGEVGWLAHPSDAEEWREAMIQAAQDDSSRLALGERAREHARAYSWDRTAIETMRCYREI